MVVGQYDGRGVVVQRPAHDLARVDARLRQGAREHRLGRDDSQVVVQEHGHELLLVRAGEQHREVLLDQRR